MCIVSTFEYAKWPFICDQGLFGGRIQFWHDACLIPGVNEDKKLDIKKTLNMKKLVLFTALILSAFTFTIGQMSMNGYHGGHNGGGPQGNHIGYNNHGPPMMSQGQFQQALHQISNQRYESSRLSVAKQITRNNQLQSSHVRDIMHQFSFESTRLSYARFAYNHVMDPQNYFMVNDAFNYSSSVRALEQHIGSRPQGQGNVGINHGAGGPQGGTLQVNGGIRPVTINNPNVGINHGAGGGHHGSMNNQFNHGSHYGHPAHNMIMESDFCRIVDMMKRKCFDSDKLIIAKQGICNGMITAEQALQMTRLFTFESTRLEFAKFAYLKTCDQRNYFIVNDAFTFSSSIRELECYIRSV